VDSLSSAALTSCDESGLHVRLELIDELQESFKKVLGFRGNWKWFKWEIWWHSRNSEVIGSIRNSSASSADDLTPGVFGPQQRQPRHRAALLHPLELPKFSGGYANFSDFYSMFTTIIDSHPDLTNVEKLQHLRSCLRDAALETILSLEISDGNYAIALDLLQNRFYNRRLVF